MLHLSEVLGSTIDLKDLVAAINTFLDLTVKPNATFFFLKDEKSHSGFIPVLRDSASPKSISEYQNIISHFLACSKEAPIIIPGVLVLLTWKMPEKMTIVDRFLLTCRGLALLPSCRSPTIFR